MTRALDFVFNYFARIARYRAECARCAYTPPWRGADGYWRMLPFPWRAWLLWGLHLLPIVSALVLLVWWLA